MLSKKQYPIHWFRVELLYYHSMKYESNRYAIQNQPLDGTFYFCLHCVGQVSSGISISNLCRTLLWYPMAAFLIEHEKNAVFLLPVQVPKLVNNVINIVAYFSVGNCRTSNFVLLDLRYFNICSTLVWQPRKTFVQELLNLFSLLCKFLLSIVHIHIPCLKF